MPTENGDLTVLLVEDDRALARETMIGLEHHGMVVTHVVTGRDVVRAAEGRDVVLLDLGLPDLEGMEVCRRLRARSAVPIIVLSGRTAEIDRVQALELGADDFLIKPFGLRELVARIHAVRRRGVHGGELVLRASDLELDRRHRRATLDGHEVQLAAKEFDLLAHLMEAAGEIVTRRQLLDEVWGAGWHGEGRTLDVHVSTLRRKLGDASRIETVRGVGFRLAATAEVPGSRPDGPHR